MKTRIPFRPWGEWLPPVVFPTLLALLSACHNSQSSAPPHLTAAQQKILAEPATTSPDAAFSFDAPSGPQFTGEQKQAQREAAKRILPMVRAAFLAGAKSVRIPPGDYRFGKETRSRDGKVFPLEFNGLKRPADQTFTIDATGATFWFDFPDDQAHTAHSAVGFKDCANLIFRGAIIDRGTRGHVEGKITDIDFAGNRIEIQLSPGLTVPASFHEQAQQRLLPFKADGTFCAPLYALQSGTRLKYRGITPGSQPGRCWVEMKEDALLNTIRNPDWQRAYGELGVLRVGDGLSCIYTVSCALEIERSRNITIAGIRVYMPKAWGAEWGGDGGHLWKNVYFGPRPGTSQWQGGEGFMFCATRRGTTLDHVTLRHTGDDMANFHGYWGNIQSSDGNRVNFKLSPQFQRGVLPDLAAGDRVLFHDKNTGQQLGEALVTGVEGTTVILNRTVDGFANAIAEFPDHACAGWTIQNCDWQDNYQRLLIQSGAGTVRNCTFARNGSSIQLNSDMTYVEGGIPRDITIANNVFIDVSPAPNGAAIEVYSRTFDRLTQRLRNIAITGNTFLRPGEAAIALTNVSGGVIANNRFERPVEYTALARPKETHRQQAISLTGCSDIQVQGNVLSDPGGYTTPDATTGSAILGCDNQCAGIRLDDRPDARLKTKDTPKPAGSAGR